MWIENQDSIVNLDNVMTIKKITNKNKNKNKVGGGHVNYFAIKFLSSSNLPINWVYKTVDEWDKSFETIKAYLAEHEVLV